MVVAPVLSHEFGAIVNDGDTAAVHPFNDGLFYHGSGGKYTHTGQIVQHTGKGLSLPGRNAKGIGLCDVAGLLPFTLSPMTCTEPSV